jgi:putative Mg2+ transporter-C (MgtC) family protein
MTILHPTLQDILLRLILASVAGSLIGFDRGVTGHAAGLRTTILVGLAAALAMILANILLSTAGKEADSFGVMDPMRLPLGVLTGVGFIGGGAILKQGGSVKGVTTAATLWIMTAIGLCLGAGQFVLGVIATALTVIVLWAMRWIDTQIPREHRAVLVIETGAADPTGDVKGLIRPLGYKARFLRSGRTDVLQGALMAYELRWMQPEAEDASLDVLAVISRKYNIKSFEMISTGEL